MVLLTAVVSAVAAITLGSVYSDDLTRGGESLARVIRDVGLAAAVPPSAVLALWRGCVAQRQAETDRRQADIALQGHLNERYQKGIELLDSERMMIRIGAVHALQDLALESPGSHLAQVVRVLCAFARHPPEDAGDAGPEAIDRTSEDLNRLAREDVVTAVRAAIDCIEQQPEAVRAARLRLDLQGALLPEVNLQNADLTGAQLQHTTLARAQLQHT